MEDTDRNALTQSTRDLDLSDAVPETVGGDMPNLEATQVVGDGLEDEPEDPDDVVEIEQGILSLPCPQCGKPFGQDVEEYKGTVPPQQLHPCGCSICAPCIQSWESKCEDKHAPMACPICNTPITGLVPNRLYCDMVLELMRAELTTDQEKTVLLALYKQNTEMLGILIGRNAGALDVVVSLRAAAQEQKNRADALEQTLEQKEKVIEDLTEELNQLKTVLDVIKSVQTKQ